MFELNPSVMTFNGKRFNTVELVGLKVLPSSQGKVTDADAWAEDGLTHPEAGGAVH